MNGRGRAYGMLLRLYPRAFREHFGPAMLDFHRDRMRAAREAGASLTLVWIRVIADVLASAFAERLRAASRGASKSVQLRPKPEEHPMRRIRQDVHYALRGLRRRPAFTAVLLATLALGIGANAAIFSVVNGILLRPLPWPHAEQVFSFGHEAPQWLTSEPDFLDYHRDMTTLTGLAAYTKNTETITGGDQPERIRVARTSSDFFPVLGVKPVVGRTFAPDDHASEPAPIVLISYSLWQRRFAGSPRVIGSTMLLNGFARTVIGVMPPHFDYPETSTDVWLPMRRFNPDSLDDRTNHYLFMVGRRKPGVSLDRSKLEANLIAQRIMRTYPDKFDPKVPLVPHLSGVTDDLLGKTRPYLLALLGAVGFVLLIACANVANLLLARNESRRAEMSIRTALGASTARLATQLLTESGMLAAGGAVVGLTLAWVADRALIALAPASIPRLNEIGLDWRVLAFTAAAALVTGLLVGVVPALRVPRDAVAGMLKESSKSLGAHAGNHGVRRALVAAEVALAVIMLAGSGMLLRSLLHLQQDVLGFDPRNVLTAEVALPELYSDARAQVFYSQLLDRLRAVPGVRSAAAAAWLPVVDAGGLWLFEADGSTFPPGSRPLAEPQQVTPDYFSAAGLKVVKGRSFSPGDNSNAPPVAIVSRKFAQLAWLGADPIGKRFKLGGSAPWLTVVGVVDDIRSRGFGDTPGPSMYFPYAQSTLDTGFQPRTMSLLVRTVGDPLAVSQAMQAAVHALDRTAPVSQIRTLDEIVGTSVSNRRFNTSLLIAFAGLALLLAGIGTYGVISYGVSQRTFEIGVRMALGAERRRVLGLVMLEGVRMCAFGIAFGVLGAVGLGRGIRSLLVGVPMIDAPTLAVTCVVLLVVAAAASAIPARRAMGVSPTEALRGP